MSNNVAHKVNERIAHLVNNSFTYKHTNCLSSPVVENALNNMKKGFCSCSDKKGMGNITLACEGFYASLLLKKYD